MTLASKQEPNDCGVRALAAACEVPYKVAHRALQLEGRAPGWPTNTEAMMKAARRFGYVLKTERVFRPPLTDTGLPWKGNFILVFTDHAAGALDGELVDNYYDLAGPLTAVLRPKRLKGAQQKIDSLMSDSFCLQLRLWYKQNIKEAFAKRIKPQRRTLCRVCIRKLRKRKIFVTLLTGFTDVYGHCDECRRGADSAMCQHDNQGAMSHDQESQSITAWR